ncbi:VOC family protein [Haloplanus sp. GCM10025708]|uniref:VOC family protein n=1 Tax=Haloferacaceae TaxID=1644056 RepID=UPI003610FF23
MDDFHLPAATRVGRVALRVNSLDDVLPFYRDVLGLDVRRDGTTARLLAGDDALLVLSEDDDAPARSPDEAGLFHLAIRVPDRAALADALGRARAADESLTGASDHLVSEALYFRDPENNGVEVYRDRPRSAWPWTDDGVAMATRPLDLDDLAAAGDGEALPPATDLGHVHLEVTDLSRAEAFYADALGLNVRARYGDEATFLAAGDYHHHVGLNTWNDRRAPASRSRGLAWFELVVPDGETLSTVRRRLDDRGHDVDSTDGAADPDGIRVRFVVE